MKNTLHIDRAGRVVIPLPIRRQFRLNPGDRLDLKVLPDGLMLSPPVRYADLVKENGLLVHEGEPDGDLSMAVQLARSGRDAAVRGTGM